MRVFSFLDGAFDGIHPWIIVGGIGASIGGFFHRPAREEGRGIRCAGAAHGELMLSARLFILAVYA